MVGPILPVVAASYCRIWNHFRHDWQLKRQWIAPSRFCGSHQWPLCELLNGVAGCSLPFHTELLQCHPSDVSQPAIWDRIWSLVTSRWRINRLHMVGDLLPARLQLTNHPPSSLSSLANMKRSGLGTRPNWPVRYIYPLNNVGRPIQTIETFIGAVGGGSRYTLGINFREEYDLEYMRNETIYIAQHLSHPVLLQALEIGNECDAYIIYGERNASWTPAMWVSSYSLSPNLSRPLLI